MSLKLYLIHYEHYENCDFKVQMEKIQTIKNKNKSN